MGDAYGKAFSKEPKDFYERLINQDRKLFQE